MSQAAKLDVWPTAGETPPENAVPASNQTDDLEEVWTLQQLRVLNELPQPVSVIASGVCEDPHRCEQYFSFGSKHCAQYPLQLCTWLKSSLLHTAAALTAYKTFLG